MNKTVFRIGDVVKIDPDAYWSRRVKRVGYPMDWRDVQLPPDMDKFANSLQRNKYSEKVEVALRQYLVKVNHFGGNDRAVHFHAPETKDEWAYPFAVSDHCFFSDSEPYEITAIVTRKIGRYVAGGWSGEFGYDPGCLHNEKSVRIAQVTSGSFSAWYLTSDLTKIEVH